MRVGGGLKKLSAAALAGLATVALAGAGGLSQAQQGSGRSGRGQGGPAAPADVREDVEALRSPDDLTRAAAAYRLKKRGAAARAAVPALVELLGDAAVVDPNLYRKGERWWRPTQDFTVGQEAAGALAEIGEAAVEPLIGAPRRPEAEARKNAAWALGAVGDSRAAAALREALKDADRDVREQAAWALSAIGDLSRN